MTPSRDGCVIRAARNTDVTSPGGSPSRIRAPQRSYPRGRPRPRRATWSRMTWTLPWFMPDWNAPIRLCAYMPLSIALGEPFSSWAYGPSICVMASEVLTPCSGAQTFSAEPSYENSPPRSTMDILRMVIRAAHLGLNPKLCEFVSNRRVIPYGVAVRVVVLDPVDDVLVPPHRDEVPAGPNSIEVQAHRAHVPSSILFAQQRGLRHAYVLKEGLVGPGRSICSADRRLGIALDGPQRSNRYAGCIHWEDEYRDSSVLWSVRVRPCHEVNVRGDVGRRGVHLLAVNDIIVAVFDRPCTEGRQGRHLRWAR